MLCNSKNSPPTDASPKSSERSVLFALRDFLSSNVRLFVLVRHVYRAFRVVKSKNVVMADRIENGIGEKFIGTFQGSHSGVKLNGSASMCCNVLYEFARVQFMEQDRTWCC
jgi:hypothetical protein